MSLFITKFQPKLCQFGEKIPALGEIEDCDVYSNVRSWLGGGFQFSVLAQSDNTGKNLLSAE